MKKNKFKLNDGGDPEKPKPIKKPNIQQAGYYKFDSNKVKKLPDGALEGEALYHSYEDEFIKRKIKLDRLPDGTYRANGNMLSKETDVDMTIKDAEKDVKNYYNKLYSSDFYKTQFPNINTKEKKALLNSVKVKYAEKDPSLYKFFSKLTYGDPNVPSRYLPNKHTIEMKGQDYLFELDGFNSALAHEVAHATNNRPLKTLGLAKNINLLNPKLNLHDKSPEELQADANAARYLLYKNGLWDMKKKIDVKSWEELKGTMDDDVIQTLEKVIGTDSKKIVELLNTTAYQDNDMKKTNKVQYANNGGKVGFQDVAGLASAFVNPISAIPSALNLIGKLAYNPASYSPAKMNESPMGYAYGGDMEQALQIMGGNDQQMGDHAVQVEGNPGVDTNYRNIGGQDVALTQGEIVRQDQDGSAYVWSNNPKMKHPSGTTFAKAMKPIENKIARLKSRVEKDHTDVYASNALGHLEQMVEQNKNIEETMRQKKGSPTAQRFNKGGYIKANDGYKILRDGDPTSTNYGAIVGTEGGPIDNQLMSHLVDTAYNKRNFGNNYATPSLEGKFGFKRQELKGLTDTPFTVSPKIDSPSQHNNSSPLSGNPKSFLAANPSPLTSVAGTAKRPSTDLSTFGDKAFMATKGLETAFRIGAALDKPMQYDTRRYNVDRIRYSPQRALDANQANYQGAQYDINTGNANTDRILRNNLYGQKMAADRDVIGKNDQMQNQSDLQVNQYNAQAKANVDNINEQIRGRDYQATDAALTSIGNLSSIFQQAGGAKAHNRITMSTLNSLSRRYGIDVPELMALMQGEGDLNKGTVKYKGK